MDQPPNRTAAQRVREILDLALERPSGEREAFVAGACAGDTPLRDEVLSLLRVLDDAGDLLEPPVAAPSPPAEPLTGLRFGPYTVGERIGAGGMGVVYVAHDTRLGRTVAVKVLPPGLAADAHRRARFEQEARVVAALNHPNIAAIYGVEDTPRGPVMVLEHVPGLTLAEALDRGRMPPDEAIGIARQIARALEAAHAAGIVHRDLKPANIKLTPDGAVKVLDFGIAKMIGAAGIAVGSGGAGAGDAPQHTRAGDMVGTAAYMSPEQARARVVDRRTDLWAFGCVLFEMLSGRRAFAGETTSDSIAALLRAEPDWAGLPADTPPSVRRVLRRCLEKDADLRLRDAGDARLDMEEAQADPAGVAVQPGAGARRILTAAALLLAGAAIAVMLLQPRHVATRAGPLSTRFSIDLSPTAPLDVDHVGGCMAVSPDGRQVAYTVRSGSGSPRLFVRRLDSLEAVELAQTGDALCPCFSPDGRWIAYWDPTGAGEIKRISVEGGAPITVVSCPRDTFGIAWAPDDTIIYAHQDGPGLLRVPVGGGPPVPVTRLSAHPGDYSHVQPEVLPGGDAVVFTCLRSEADHYRSSIDLVRPSTGERRTLVEGASQPRYLPGRLLYFQDGFVLSAPLDLGRLVLTGEPRRVLGPIAGNEMVPPPRYAVSAGGTLAFLPSLITYEAASDVAWFGVDGSVTTVFQGKMPIESLRLSPDGRLVALAAGANPPDVWVLDLGRGVSTRLTNDGNRFYPVWSADGRRVAFQAYLAADSHRIDWAPGDGSAPAETLYTIPRPGSGYPNAFTPDGKFMILTMNSGPGTREDLYLLPLDGSGVARPLFDSPAPTDRFGARLSPDGSLLAYTGTQTGGMEVYLQPFPSLDRRIRVSTDGGMRAAWGGDSSRLYFRWQDRLYAADVTASPELSASVPRVLLSSLPQWRYDAAADGSKFIMGKPAGGSGPQTRINVVVNWESELLRAPAGNAVPR